MPPPTRSCRRTMNLDNNGRVAPMHVVGTSRTVNETAKRTRLRVRKEDSPAA